MGAFSQNVADAEMELVDDISLAESNDNMLSAKGDAHSEIVVKEKIKEREVNQVKLESKEIDSRIKVKADSAVKNEYKTIVWSYYCMFASICCATIAWHYGAALISIARAHVQKLCG